MRIAIINPNTTVSMTGRIVAAATAAAGTETTIIGSQPVMGPDAIEGPFDGALSVPGLLKQILRAEADGAEAHIIACFDDTGLDAARALATKPVIGMGEASFHAVSLVAHSFCVVTTLSRSAPVIEDNIHRYGFSRRCRRVFASDIPVLELEKPGKRCIRTHFRVHPSRRRTRCGRGGARLRRHGAIRGRPAARACPSSRGRRRRRGGSCGDTGALWAGALEARRLGCPDPCGRVGEFSLTTGEGHYERVGVRLLARESP